MARDTILHLPVLFYPRTLRVSAFQLITHEELSFFHLDSLLSFHSRSPLYYYYYFTCLDASIFSLSLYSLLLPSFFLEREKENISLLLLFLSSNTWDRPVFIDNVP